MTQEIATVLERAADLIEPEGAWQRGGYFNKDKTCFCVVGAIAKALHTSPSDAETWIVRSKIGSRFLGLGRDGWLIEWNDRSTQAEVVAKLREAAAKARGEA